MPKQKIKPIEMFESVAETKLRASKQGRFKKNNGDLFSSIYLWAKNSSEIEPPYVPNSRKRDAWLRQYVQKEPFLHGVLANVVTIDKNRGWTMMGAEHIVRTYVDRFHWLHAAPDQIGWRPTTAFLSHAYHCADIGAIGEIEWANLDISKGFQAEFNSIYTVDPAQCYLTGDVEYPLAYTENGVFAGKDSEWSTQAYFRIVDGLYTNSKYNGLGVSSVSRCLELAKILTALYDHDAEKLLSKAPRGLLLLQGISEDQWEQTLKVRGEQMTELEKRYYSGVQVLAGGMEKISAELVSLSQIPEGLDHETFTNIAMYLYALAFKYDPREFWPVSGGQLGTATETEVQHRKATGKGGMDFILAYQEQLQELLPPTVQFEFEARDVEGEAKDEALTAAVIANIVALVTAQLITIEQGQVMLSEAEVIHKEWASGGDQMTSDKEDNPEGAGDIAFAQRPLATLPFLQSPQGANALSFLQQKKSPLADFLQKRNSHLSQLNQRIEPRLEDEYEIENEAIARSLFYYPNQRLVKYVENNGVGKYLPIEVKRKAKVAYSFRNKQRADITDHDGSMIALFMPEPVAKQLRKIANDLGLPNDSLQETQGNMHLTLAYFPDTDFNDPMQLDNAKTAVQLALQDVNISQPLQGNIQGYGIFNGGKDGPVLYASLDVPELNALRASLCSNLEKAGLVYAKDHGFTHHITLAYLGEGFVLPSGFAVPDIAVTFDAVYVVNGKEHTPVFIATA